MENIFRCWDEHNNEFIYSNTSDGDGCFFINTKGILFMYKIPYEDKYYKIDKYIGLKDKKNNLIFTNDILTDGKIKFRIYEADFGGYIVKARPWAENMNDLVLSDQLIYESLSGESITNCQTEGWITQNCEIIENIYENKKNKLIK